MRYVIALLVSVLLVSCAERKEDKRGLASLIESGELKIASLNGAFTEIICAAGYEKNLVAVDLTSTYPESVKKLTNLGHNRSMQAEGIISARPNVVIGSKKEVNPAIVQQLESAGIKVLLFDHDYSVEGTSTLITAITDSLKKKEKGVEMVNKIKEDVKNIKPLAKKPKVLFIYARGAKTLNVAGKDTKLARMIELAGGENAFYDFTEFKPLTAEALIQANPDVILMFESGLQSVDGMNGLENIAGIKETNAGKNKAVITMDDLLLSGFGPRVGEGAVELNKKLAALQAHE